MSTRWKGGLMTASPPATYGGGTAPGIWTLNQQGQLVAANLWPLPGASRQLWAWGKGNAGSLGFGNTTNYSSPKQVGPLVIWKSVEGGIGGYGSNTGITVGVRTDGTLWTWGSGVKGALGLGNITNYSSPKQVGALTTWSSASGGAQRVGAITTTGALWVWGFNSQGTLGLNNTTSYSSPKQVGALTNWAQISMGSNASAAVKTDGTLWTWGYNSNYELGLGNNTTYYSPKQVGSSTNWASVNSASRFMLAVKTDNTLWGWGQNAYGQIGTGNLTTYSNPKQIGALTNWSSVSSRNLSTSYASTLAIKTNNTLWGWGRNGYGSIGLGNTTSYSSPKQVGALSNWSTVAFGGSSSNGFTISVKTDGTLWTWGNNNFGQLGSGTTTSRSSPAQVGALTTWITARTGAGTSYLSAAFAIKSL